MKTLMLLAVGAVLGLLTHTSRGDEKPDFAKLIVGKWEVTKADKGTVPAGSVFEFAKDGQFKVTAKEGGEKTTIEGTYTVEKDALTLTRKMGDRTEARTITITNISDKAMSAKDQDGKVAEFEKLK